MKSRERLTAYTQVSSEPNVEFNLEFVHKGKGMIFLLFLIRLTFKFPTDLINICDKKREKTFCDEFKLEKQFLKLLNVILLVSI